MVVEILVVGFKGEEKFIERMVIYGFIFFFLWKNLFEVD